MIDVHFFELAYNAGKTGVEGLNNAFNGLEISKINNLHIKVRLAEIKRSIDNLEWQLKELNQKKSDLHFLNLFDKQVVEQFKNGTYNEEEFDKWVEVIQEAIDEDPVAMGEIRAEVLKNA